MSYSPSHFIYFGVWSDLREHADAGLPEFLVTMLKKALSFDYATKVTFKGIPAIRYNASTGRQFMNDTLYPPNAQFFQFGPSGVFNMTHCFQGLPLFFSLPKFYGAPDFYANNSKMGIAMPEGLEDNGYVVVEPMTGAALEAKVALQGNTQLMPIPGGDAKNVSRETPSLKFIPRNVMVPTYLMRYEAELPDKGAKTLSKQINFADNLGKAFFVVAYVCMGLMVLWWSYSMFWCGKYVQRRSE